MRDLLHKTEKYAGRIQFTDDILVNNYVKDVTDAVTAIRDSCCHVDSFKSHFDAYFNRGKFIIVYGKGDVAKINDLEIKSEYEDDIAIFFGANRLYMKRGVIRAFEESAAKVRPFLEASRI